MSAGGSNVCDSTMSPLSTMPSCAWALSMILTNFGSLLLDILHSDEKDSLSKDRAGAPCQFWVRSLAAVGAGPRGNRKVIPAE